MRVNFLFYLDEVNQRRVRPRVVWGFWGFIAGVTASIAFAAIV